MDIESPTASFILRVVQQRRVSTYELRDVRTGEIRRFTSRAALNLFLKKLRSAGLK